VRFFKKFVFVALLTFPAVAFAGQDDLSWCCDSYAYDSLGRVSTVSYGDCACVSKRNVFTYTGQRRKPDSHASYDAENKMLRMKRMFYDRLDSLTGYYSVTYVDFQSGKPGTLPSLNPEAKQDRTLYAVLKEIPDTFFWYCERNSAGFIVKDSSCYSGNNIKSRSFYTWSSGRLVESVFQSSEISYTSKSVYVYDQRGNLAEENAYLDPGSGLLQLLRQTIYEYDEHGKLLFVKYYWKPETPSQAPEIYRYSYNKQGKLIAIDFVRSASSRKRYKIDRFEYAHGGQLLRHCHYTSLYD
jgi:hypothetical protein